MTPQILDGALTVTPKVVDWRSGVLFAADGTLSNIGTKGNITRIAGIFGDWREEMLPRAADGARRSGST